MSTHLDEPTLQRFIACASSEEEAVSVALHLDDCPACTARLEALDPLFEALAALPEPKPPPDLVAAVLRAAAAPERAPTAELFVGGGLLLAAAVVVVGFGKPLAALTQVGVALQALGLLLAKAPAAGPLVLFITLLSALTLAALAVFTASPNPTVLARRLT